MTVITTESFLREPNLLVKNKKPVGPVKINTSHPLAKGMIACWLFQGDNGIDLTSKYHGNKTGSSISSGIDIDGVYVRNTTNNTTNRFDLGSITSNDRLSGCVTNKLSCYVYSYIASSGYNSQYPRWIDKSDGGSASNGWAFYLDVTTDDLYYSHGGQNLQGVDLSPYYNANRGLAFSADPLASGNEFWQYVDGELVLTKSTSTAPNLTSYPTTTTNACLLNWNHATDRQYYFPVYCIYVWDRVLSDSEHRSIHNDRYQFLIPA